MTSLVLLVGLSVAISAQFVASASYDARNMYKFQRGKTYKDPQTDALRSIIFSKNNFMVEQFNNKKAAMSEFTIDLNRPSDRIETEKSRPNGFNSAVGLRTSNSLEAQKFLDEILNDNSIAVPDELDWRKTAGRVTRVKNQGDCDSGWAFSATGALEGQLIVRKLGNNSSINRDLIELSEQNLVDCTKDASGCKGGSMMMAFNLVKSEQGIESGQSYQYKAYSRPCEFNKTKSVFIDSGGASLPSGDEQKLKEVVAKFGPVSVSIDASSIYFKCYNSGVYYDNLCGNKDKDLNHGVLIVGYGTDPDQGDYWLVKNSWGERWGEKGYIRMSRNNGNNCGIATAAVIPTFLTRNKATRG